MDLTLPILGVIGYVAYTFSEKEARKRRELRKEKSTTVGDNIYSSDEVRKNTKYVQALADDRYAKSKNTKETKIVPNFFNNSCQVIDCDAKDLVERRKKLAEFPTAVLPKENFSALAGGKVDISKHKATVQPFFRGSSTGTRKTEDADLVGLYTGNQRTYKTKEEALPFFTPAKQDVFGLNTVNKDATRYVGSLYKNGEKPIEEKRVRFINEADLRPVYRNLDQLQIDPKQTYKAIFKTGQNTSGTTRGLVGEVAKNRPETFFENSESRYIVDTSLPKSITNQKFQETEIDASERAHPLAQIFASDKLKQQTRISKDAKDGITGLFADDSRNTDKTFGINGAVSGNKKPVNNTTEGMKLACRVEIENYINSAGNSANHRVRLENVNTSPTKENYSDLNGYTFKKAAGSASIPESSKINQHNKDDDNKTKYGGLRFSRISEGTPTQEYSGKAKLARENPKNTRLFQDIENLPANELIKKFS